MLSCLRDNVYKKSMLLIGWSSLCGGSVFPFSLSEWSFTTGVGSGGGGGGKGGTFLIGGGSMVCLCPPTFNPTFLFST